MTSRSLRLVVLVLGVALLPTVLLADTPAGLPGLAPGLDAPAPAADLAPVEGPEVASKACSASALCSDGSTISCTHSGSGSCQGVNYFCSGQVGYVRCDRTTTYCSAPDCPQSCPGTLSCEDLNAGNYGPGVCPERCIDSTGFCGECFEDFGGTCVCPE